MLQCHMYLVDSSRHRLMEREHATESGQAVVPLAIPYHPAMTMPHYSVHTLDIHELSRPWKYEGLAHQHMPRGVPCVQNHCN